MGADNTFGDGHFNPDSTDFELSRVKKLVDTNQILSRTFERTTKRWNRGEASYRAIFNALIKHDKAFMAQYQQTVC